MYIKPFIIIMYVLATQRTCDRTILREDSNQKSQCPKRVSEILCVQEPMSDRYKIELYHALV